MNEESDIYQLKQLTKETEFLFFIGASILLYLISLNNYLLFHSTAELFTIVIGISIFFIYWNSREYTENRYFLFLGISYLFVSTVDLLHTLAYKGMGVFPIDDANLSTQLWIIARYLESLSLLIATIFINHRLNARKIFSGYFSVTTLLLASIFYFKVFPDCFIEGKGLTDFKILSEYLIIVILLTSSIILYLNRTEFESKVYQFLILAMISTMLAELAFTFYVSVYGFSNLVGHYFKLISFYFIYRAIIVTNLRNPYNILFRNLKKSEENLRKSEQMYKNITEISQEIILRVSSKGRCTYINRAGAKFFGITKEEILGQPVINFIQNDQQEQTIKIFDEAIKNKEPIDGYTNFLEVPKGVRAIKWNMSPILQNNNVSGVQVTGRDVTEQHQELIEKEKLAAIGQLAAGVAHEINTPLANINLTVEYLQNILSEEKLTLSDQGCCDCDQIQAELTDIKEQVEFCAQVVRDLLFYSKKIEINPTRFNLKKELRWIIKSAQIDQLLKQGKIEVKINISDDFEVFADKNLIVRVFQNLIMNSIDALMNIPNARIKLDSKMDIDQTVIKFSDNGCGISEIDLPLIFEPFFTKKRENKGTGLGLCISKGITERHRGKIEVKSELGKGTEVRVTLPIQK